MDHTSDRAAIHTVLDKLIEAWNLGDGTAYGALFTDDASYVTYVGTHYRGRDDIARGHDALFGSFLKGTKLAGEITDIRFLGDDTAVVVGRGDTYKKKPSRLRKVQTYTFVRDGGGWRIAAFQNTLHKSLMEAISFRFLPASKPT